MIEPEMTNRATFLAHIEESLEKSDFQAVLKIAEERISLIPGDVDATIAICHAWIRLGRLDEAMASLSEVEDKIARLGGIYISLGDICHNAGLLQEALRYYRRFIAIDPHSFQVGRVREEISLLAGTAAPKEVEQDDTEEELAPDFYTLSMVDLYISQGHLDMAERLLEVIVTREGLREAALERLDEVKKKRRLKMISDLAEKKRRRVVDELGRWLDNALRMKQHAF